MANVIIPKDLHKKQEAHILKNFARNNITAADRDAAQVVSARSREALQMLKRMEERYR